MDQLTQTFENVCKRSKHISISWRCWSDRCKKALRRLVAQRSLCSNRRFSTRLCTCSFITLWRRLSLGALMPWLLPLLKKVAGDPLISFESLRREWVRSTARTHLELNQDHRLEAAVTLCEHLVQALPLLDWSVDEGRRGNWADEEIKNITTRLGCELHISNDVYKGIKRPIREDEDRSVLVRYLRNKLAHGSLIVH